MKINLNTEVINLQTNKKTNIDVDLVQLIKKIEKALESNAHEAFTYFNDLKLIAANMNSLDALSKQKYIQSVLNGLTDVLQLKDIDKEMYELYAFLAYAIVYSGEKLEQKGDWNWIYYKERILSLFQVLLNKSICLVWTSTVETEMFLGIFAKTILLLLENIENIRSPIFTLMSNIVGLCFKSGFSQMQQLLLQSLHYFEHLAEPIAEILSVCCKEYQQNQIVEDILKAFATSDIDFTESHLGKTAGIFLSKCSYLMPKECLSNMMSFAELLDKDPYSLRSAVMDILKNVILYYLQTDKSENGQNQAKSLYRLIEERFRDSNSFVRSKVLQVCIDLLEAGAIPLDRRHQILLLASGRIKDKSSNVRKKALQLLGQFVKSHLFVVDGGILTLSLFDSKLVNIEKEIEASTDDTNINKLLLLKKYYLEAKMFTQQMIAILNTIIPMLMSTVKTEVIEAIDFIVMLHLYKIEESYMGIKKMLHLIWSKDTSGDEESKRTIRENLLSAFNRILFEVEGSSSDQTNNAVKFLIDFAIDLDLSELTSLEEIIGQMVKRKMITDITIQLLWAVFDGKYSNGMRRGSLIILSMCASTNQKVIENKLDLVLNNGFGKLGQEDILTAKYSCISLQRLIPSRKRIKGIAPKPHSRIPNDNLIFERLISFIDNVCEEYIWFPVIEQAINTIYILASNPDALLGTLIKRLAIQTFGNNLDSVNEKYLTKMLFIAGHCSIKQIVHLEYIEAQRKEEPSKPVEGGPMTPLRKKRLQVKRADELEGITGNVDDDFADLLFHVRENELLFGDKSLFSIFSSMAATICANNQKFNNRELQVVSNLALCKFMCVSSEYCQKHLQLLFTILEKSSDAIIRSNIVIALGDIAMSFNNLIDENIDSLYKRLGDNDSMVKKNTLMVLTHLILNGMIKVKGQIGEIARCLADENETIRNLARVFFAELSTKDNAIYNLLPDLLSNLSVSLDEQVFNTKDKHIDNITDKLCQRYKGSDNMKHWRDVSYCISLIPFTSEKSVLKLINNFPLYQDKLHDEQIYKYFMEIIGKVHKIVKSDVLTEFEAKLNRAFEGEKNETQETIVKMSKLNVKSKRVVRSAIISDSE